MDYFVSGLVGLVIIAIAIAVSTVLIPWLKNKGMMWVLEILVSAAEKLAENHPIDKKAWVIERLEELGLKITPFVDACIESAVKRLDIAIGMTSVPDLSPLASGKDEE